MGKIKLKSWQHFLIIGLLALFVVIVIFGNRDFGKKNIDEQKNMFAHFEIEYQNADSVMRLFYPGVIIGDSIRYEEIEGATTGFIIQIFLVGKECDYVLKIDSRETEELLTLGDTMIFTNYHSLEKPLSYYTLTLESRITINPSNFITDEIEMSDYYTSIMCTMKDSCISISGVVTASAYVINSMLDDDQLFINGYFRADSIPIGQRIVNGSI